MNVLSLFSGIGGLELGLERSGMTTVGQVELGGAQRRHPGCPVEIGYRDRSECAVRVTLTPAQADALLGAARAVLADVEPDFIETWPSSRVESLDSARRVLEQAVERTRRDT